MNVEILPRISDDGGFWQASCAARVDIQQLVVMVPLFLQNRRHWRRFRQNGGQVLFFQAARLGTLIAEFVQRQLRVQRGSDVLHGWKVLSREFEWQECDVIREILCIV